MKRKIKLNLFILVLIIFTQIKTRAQISNIIVKNNSTWILSKPDWSFAYFLRGDTVLEGKNYKNLCISYNSNKNNFVKTNHFLREDSNLVYLKTSANQEKLLYNFNLAVGDSFNFSFNKDIPNFRILHKIDSIKLKDNIYTSIYIFDSVESYKMTNKEMVWIKGIGSLASLIYPIEMQLFGKRCCVFWPITRN